MTRQRGLVLLPMTLMLAIVGALAYTMSRDGAMNVSAIDAQYEIDKARYLAEAGVNLVKWRNERLGCSSAQGFTAPVTALDGGTISASGVSAKGKNLAMTVSATTARGTVNQVVLDDAHGVQVHDLTKLVEITLSAQGSSDTFIRKYPAFVPAALPYLETTDGNAYGLLKFGPASVPPGALIMEATLRLYLDIIASTQPGSLGIHRLLRAWPTDVGWTAEWTTDGVAYATQPSATINQVLARKTYPSRIDALVQSWVNNPATSFGMLLKPTGLVTARFNSFEASSNQPQLLLRYYPQCT
jgi:hypothetical protein